MTLVKARSRRSGNIGRAVQFVMLPLVLVALLAWAVVARGDVIEVGDPAPGFELTSFDGKTVALSDLKGKHVLLNLWASWCRPCKQEAPHLEALWKEYEPMGLVVVGVNADDLEKNARRFITEYGISYVNLRDQGGRVKRSYGWVAFPESFFISPSGTLVDIVRGPMDGQEMRARAQRLLEQS